MHGNASGDLVPRDIPERTSKRAEARAPQQCSFLCPPAGTLRVLTAHRPLTTRPLQGQEQEALGFVRFVRLTPRGPCAEFSITVLDAEQGRGLGSALADALMKGAAKVGIQRQCFEVLTDNVLMRSLAQHMGGKPQQMDDGTLEYECAQTPAPAPAVIAPTAPALEGRIAAFSVR